MLLGPSLRSNTLHCQIVHFLTLQLRESAISHGLGIWDPYKEGPSIIIVNWGVILVGFAAAQCQALGNRKPDMLLHYHNLLESASFLSILLCTILSPLRGQTFWKATTTSRSPSWLRPLRTTRATVLTLSRLIHSPYPVPTPGSMFASLFTNNSNNNMRVGNVKDQSRKRQ